MNRIHEIEERLKNITRGPWYAGATDDRLFMNARYITTRKREFRHDDKRRMAESEDNEPETVIAITLLQDPHLACHESGRWNENTHFIAHAPEDIRWLLDEIKRLRLEVDKR